MKVVASLLLASAASCGAFVLPLNKVRRPE